MRLARYMLMSNNDVLVRIDSAYSLKVNWINGSQNIFGGNDEEALEEDDDELQAYKKNHPGFTINSFYHSAGFQCDEILKMCSFAGREFNCCECVKLNVGIQKSKRAVTRHPFSPSSDCVKFSICSLLPSHGCRNRLKQLRLLGNGDSNDNVDDISL